MPVRLRITHTTAVHIGDRLEPLGTAVVVAVATLLSLLDLFGSHR